MVFYKTQYIIINNDIYYFLKVKLRNSGKLPLFELVEIKFTTFIANLI